MSHNKPLSLAQWEVLARMKPKEVVLRSGIASHTYTHARNFLRRAERNRHIAKDDTIEAILKTLNSSEHIHQEIKEADVNEFIGMRELALRRAERKFKPQEEVKDNAD